MDRETLYLDNDEEITSVVDKLKSTEALALDIVIPKNALLLQSVVNLKLLKKQAEGLSKDITIVTQDKVGQKLATQIGIPVVTSPGEEPKVVKMTEGETKNKNFSESDIEIEEEKAEPLADPNAVVAPTSEIVKPETDSEEPEVMEPVDLTKGKPTKGKKPWFKSPKVLAIIGGFSALALFVAAYIFIPLATVTIKLAAEKKKIDLDFTVNKDATGVDTGTSTIPGKLISQEKEITSKHQATGKKDAGEKATGTVTIHNVSFSTSDFTISAGSRVVTSSGLVYLTTTNVTVGKFTKPPQVDGTATVNVQATAPGEKYNVVGGTMTIPALSSNTAEIYAVSQASFSGGTTKQITFVTQTDLNTAKEAATTSSQAELKQLIMEGAASDERLLDEAMEIKQLSAEPSVAVNGEATEFDLKVKFSLRAIVYKEEDLAKLAENTLAEQIGATKELVEKESLLSAVTFTDANFDSGAMHARLSGEAFIATKLEQEKIKTELSGDGEQNALSYLKGIDGVDDAEIKFFPSFLKRVPRVKAHIYLKINLAKVQE